MSYNYSKSEIKKVYNDIEGTKDKFMVAYLNGLPNHPTKENNIIMYITEHSIVFRNKYDPAKLAYNLSKDFFLSIGFEQIKCISFDGIPLQNIDISTINTFNSCYNLLCVFVQNNETYYVSFFIAHYLNNKKNLTTAKELIESINSIKMFSDLFPKKLPSLYYNKLYCLKASLNKELLSKMLIFDDGILIGSNDNSISDYIYFDKIISCKKVYQLNGIGRSLHQDLWFILKYKVDEFEKQIAFRSSGSKYSAKIDLELLLENLGISITGEPEKE